LSGRRGRPTRLVEACRLRLRSRRRASRRSTGGDFCSGVRASWSTLHPSREFRGAPVSPPASSQRGHSAPRSGPRTSRARGYEPRPRAPYQPKSVAGPWVRTSLQKFFRAWIFKELRTGERRDAACRCSWPGTSRPSRSMTQRLLSGIIGTSLVMTKASFAGPEPSPGMTSSLLRRQSPDCEEPKRAQRVRPSP
jgi:hypothetical protein